MTLKRTIAMQQKELKRAKRDLKFVHGKTRINEANIRIANLEEEIRNLDKLLAEKKRLDIGVYAAIAQSEMQEEGL